MADSLHSKASTSTDNSPVAITADPEAQSPKEKFADSNAGDGTVSFDQHITGIPFVLCFFACFVTMFLIGLDQTIVVTLLEKVGVQFNAYDQIGWITSGYMLSMAVLAQTWGKVSIIIGRKYAMLLAIVVFESGSLMCALSQNMNTLIGGRVLAGVGGGGLQTLIFVVMSEIVPINKRAVIFSIFGALMPLSTVTGPLIGGAFTENVTWRWCFYINLPLGGLAIVALACFYHPPMPKFTWRQKVMMVDYVGSFLLAAGLVLLLLAVSMGGTNFAWKSGAVISMFILSPVTLCAFSIWNFKYSKNPILPWSIIRVPAVLIPCIGLFFTFYTFMAMMVYLSTYFEVIHGASAIATGLHFLPLIISMAITSVSTGILMRKTRYVKPFIIAGGVIAPLASGLCALLSVDSGNAANIGYLILPGVAIGLTMQSSILATQINAPKEPGSMILVTTLANFTRAVGGALGSELAQTVFNSSVKLKGVSLYNSDPSLFDGMTYEEFSAILGDPSELDVLSAEAKRAVLKTMMSSIHNVFYMCIGAGAMMLICSLLNSNNRIPAQKDIKTKEEYEKEQNEKEQNEKAGQQEKPEENKEEQGATEDPTHGEKS